jgi:large subunit ribosomal protein L3
VTQVKTAEKDRYQAVQLGFGKKKHLTKPLEGHLKGLENFRYLREFRVTDGQKLKRGDKVTANIFQAGEQVQVTGVSKGKGYQGVVKRHHFAGHPSSHGHRHDERMPGSIGSRFPQHTRKGIRMAGRMGHDQVSKVTSIIKVDAAAGVLAVKGPLPGAYKTLVMIHTLS